MTKSNSCSLEGEFATEVRHACVHKTQESLALNILQAVALFVYSCILWEVAYPESSEPRTISVPQVSAKLLE